ncbi:MAG TPA: oligoendopeptidase F [Bacillota bacterium]|nr:oligoendopeptidase F [Bacillota bacterium]
MMKQHGAKKLLFVLLTIFIVSSLGTVLLAADGPPKRDQIEERYKWNLADIYADQNAIQKDFDRIEKELIPKIETFNGKLTTPNKVLECFQVYETLSRLVDKVYVYSHLKADENQADNDASELASQTETLNSKALEATSFIQPEIINQPEATINSWIKNSLLKDYRHFLDSLLKQKAHTLSKPEEKILASASDFAGAPNDIYNKARVADLTFPKIKDDQGTEIQLSNGVYSVALESHDREYRKRAFEGIYSSFDKIKNTLAATLNAEVKKNIFFAKARKYNSSLEASLAGEYVPREVYDNLVASVNNNVQYLNKYIALRQQVLGLDKVRIYDMYVPLVESYEMKVSYEEAQKIIPEGLKGLGADYLKAFQTGLNSRWIDVYETENKATGGYQWGTYDTHPYILLNYMNSVDDMLTLAHEMGHALNSFYTNKAQKYIYSNVPIFTAEVASTTNELLMDRYLIANAKNDEERLYLINNLVENIRGTVYTQVMYAEFEKAISERVEKGDALSAKSLNEIWTNLMVKYYGPNFEMDTLAALWWARIPHFYMNFYVYKYATSMAAANQVVKNMTEGNSAGYQEKYLNYLKAGGSDYPIAVLKGIDVDLTSTKPVDNLLADFGKLVDEMEGILKKQGKIKLGKI